MAPFVGQAQTAPAPDCPPVGAGNALCLTLDARRSVDSLAGALVFRWDLGDGQVREGVQFDYCYARPGHYRIRLDVIDPRTQQVRPAEYERVIDLSDGTPAPIFTGPDTVAVGRPAAFALDRSSLPGCLRARLRLNWSFGEGPAAHGERADHTFRKPGTYLVRLELESPDLGPQCVFRPCASRLITVRP